MNKQTKELLNILLNSPNHHFSYENLAETLHVSTRTIRNYIQSVQTFLQDNGHGQALTVYDKGVSISGSPDLMARLQESMVDYAFYSYRLSPAERQGMLLLMLLISDDYCTIGQLTERLKVSRGTILKDMAQIKLSLDARDLSLCPMTNNGYRLNIQEFDRRRMTAEIINNFTDTHPAQVNLYKQFILKERCLEKDMPEISRILLDVERQYQLNVPDSRFEKFLVVLAISVMRMREGKTAAGFRFDIPVIRNFAIYKMGETLFSRLCGSFRFPYSEEEVGFLAYELYEYHFYKDETLRNVTDLQLHMAVSNFLMKVSDELTLPLYQNEQLASQLERHLKDIANAHFKGIQFHNEYSKSMRGEYPVYYQAVEKHIAILERSAGYSYSDDELAFVMFYVMTSAEKYFQEYQKPKVIVAYHTGIGTADFLAEQLINNFNIEISAVVPSHKLDETLQEHSPDLIVTTAPLESQKLPWLKVSPMLKDEDILSLQKLFIQIRRKKRQHEILKSSKPLMKTGSIPEITGEIILKKENILLDADCADWQAAIRAAAQPLLREGAIRPVYVDKIIESVQKNNAYFVYCPGVALAHAGPEDGVVHFGLSLVRLKKPVRFGHPLHDPVSYILCLASPAKDARLQKVLVLMNLLSEPHILQSLNTLTLPEEILEFVGTSHKEELNEK